MGDHRDQFIHLDTTDDTDTDTAGHRAHEVRTFLRNQGLAEPDERAADEIWPHAIIDRPGPAWKSTWHQYSPGSRLTPWRTIAVVHTTEVDDPGFFAMDSTGPPSCRTCAEKFDEDTFWTSFKAWYEGGNEPVLNCATCGEHGLIGDQDTTSSAVIGRVAVITDGATGDVITEMLQALSSDLGGRWAYVHMHS